jgi:capsular exopolysaccharide synthesis family protein
MELKTLLSPLRKWWWLIFASTLIASATSYLAVQQQPPMYSARATLLLGNALNNPNPNGYEFWLSQQLAQTYTNIAQRESVQSAVMENLGLSWLPEYSSRVVPDTHLIELTVTDSSPERAMVVANELANQLILQTPSNVKSVDDAVHEEFVRQQLDELRVKIQETSDTISSKQEEFANLLSARQIADTQNQIAALESKLTTLQGNYASLLASSSAGAVNSLSIIEPATIPQSPVGPAMLMTVLTAAVIGLLLAACAAYLLEYMDDTVRTPDDVLEASKLPTLSGIAEYKPGNGLTPELVALTQPRSPISEAYRSLRTAIFFSNVDNKFRTLLITSPNPAEGKSVTAANLGVVMAQAGHRVLLIDADLRRPKQHRIFKLQKSFGLTNLLVQMSDTLEPTKMIELLVNVNKTVFESKQTGLFILPSGSVPPNPAEIVGSTKMKKLLEILSTRFDYIIIDSPPTLAVTDAVILSTRVDSVLMIANAGRTRRNQLKQAIRKLDEVNANLAGVVLNRLTTESGDYYYYAYHNNNYYQNQEESDDDPDILGGDYSREKKVDNQDRKVHRKLVPNFLTRLIS